MTRFLPASEPAPQEKKKKRVPGSKGGGRKKEREGTFTICSVLAGRGREETGLVLRKEGRKKNEPCRHLVNSRRRSQKRERKEADQHELRGG